MPRRSADPPKAENQERWLLTYADLITLLMIFFVVMYTISNINSKKFAQLSVSMSQALVGEKSGNFIGDAPGPMMIRESVAGGKAEIAGMKKAEAEINKYIKEQGLKDKVVVSQEERGLVISLKEALVFDLGSADITPAAKGVILSVGKILLTLPNNIRVEGHTDNLPIHTARFPSNWELSTARATNVVNFLVGQVGMKPEKLSATGYGEYRPITPNTSEPNRARNRRTDIVVLKALLDVAEPGKRPNPSDSQLFEPIKQSEVSAEQVQ